MLFWKGQHSEIERLMAGRGDDCDTKKEKAQDQVKNVAVEAQQQP
jgi:hypothetical protein